MLQVRAALTGVPGPQRHSHFSHMIFSHLICDARLSTSPRESTVWLTAARLNALRHLQVAHVLPLLFQPQFGVGTVHVAEDLLRDRYPAAAHPLPRAA